MITWFVLLLVGVVAVNGNTVPPTDESSNGNTATTMPSGTTVPSSWNVSADPPSVDATDGQLIDAATMPPLDTNGTNDSGSDEISMPLDTNGTDGNTTTKMPPIDIMDDQSTLMNTINELAADDENGLSYFRDALMACDLLDQLLDNVESEYTIFAPTNAALKANKQFLLYLQGLEDMPQSRWYYNLRTTLLYHMAPNVTLLSADIFDSQRTEIETMLGVESNYTIPVSQFSKKLGGAGLIQSNIQRSNGVLHVIDRVLVPKYLSQSLSMLELQPEYGPDVLERTALVDVVAVMDPTRSTLNQISQTGLTFAGCRIRAFNRLEEYLPQTINYSLNVTHGELLNETYAAQAKSNLLEYSLIAKNYYYDDIPDGYEELVTPLSGSKCNGAQMWITKSEGALCFNSGCTIEMPNVRKYLASNGYVHYSIFGR